MSVRPKEGKWRRTTSTALAASTASYCDRTRTHDPGLRDVLSAGASSLPPGAFVLVPAPRDDSPQTSGPNDHHSERIPQYRQQAGAVSVHLPAKGRSPAVTASCGAPPRPAASARPPSSGKHRGPPRFSTRHTTLRQRRWRASHRRNGAKLRRSALRALAKASSPNHRTRNFRQAKRSFVKGADLARLKGHQS